MTIRVWVLKKIKIILCWKRLLCTIHYIYYNTSEYKRLTNFSSTHMSKFIRDANIIK